MIKQRRATTWRRTLCVERLEDRMVLQVPGHITVNFNNGLLSITGDNFDDDVEISQVGGAITVSSSNTINGSPGPFPGVRAISVLFLDGNDLVQVGSPFGISIPGPLTIVEGTGNDFLFVDNSTFQSLDATIGREENGARGRITAELSNDIITGDHVNVSLLNESGVSGRRLNGGAGSGPGSVITFMVNAAANPITGGIRRQDTRNSFQFVGPGNLSTRVDDGVPYTNPFNASSVRMDGISTMGTINGTIGDHFQDIQIGQSAFISAGNLNETIGNDVDIVQVAGNIRKREMFSVGNVTTSPIGPLPLPMVTLFGTVGGKFGDGLFATFGSNANPSLRNGWPIEVTEGITGYPFPLPLTGLVLKAGNGVALTVDPTTVVGAIDITMGSGGVNGLESLTMLNCVSTDPQIRFNSNAGDIVRMNFTNLTVTVPASVLDVRDTGRGADLVTMSNVRLAGFLSMILANSGRNVVTAQNVKVLSGIIFGGATPGSRYIDLGGNSGYSVAGFGP